MTDKATLDEIEAKRETVTLAHFPLFCGTHFDRLLEICREQAKALEAIWPFVEEDDGQFATEKYQAAINQVRSILRK